MSQISPLGSPCDVAACMASVALGRADIAERTAKIERVLSLIFSDIRQRASLGLSELAVTWRAYEQDQLGGTTISLAIRAEVALRLRNCTLGFCRRVDLCGHYLIVTW